MKYLIDEVVLKELVHYLVSTSKNYEDIQPLIVKLMQGLSTEDQQDVINDLREDGTIGDKDKEN